jgi:hypothetical protein
MSIFNLLIGAGASAFNFNKTISSNTIDYNLYNDMITNGWNGISAVSASVTINGGVYVYASTTSTYAFNIGSFPTGSVINVVNNGVIAGRGGSGGAGSNGSQAAGQGLAAGPALYTASSVTITNNGIIGGGGGGGGGGGACVAKGSVGGSGGGGGIVFGPAGAGSNYLVSAPAGTAGTLTALGPGGASASNGNRVGGAGGDGGSYGSAGSTGGNGNTGTTFNLGAAGGAAGACVVGNSYITWSATGTRYGAIS